MKTTSLLLAITCAIAVFTTNVARGFSISAVTISPSNVVPATTELRMIIDIITPSAGTWLYAPTQVSSNAGHLRVDVYPTSGMLTVIDSLRETVPLGAFPVGAYTYEVVIHPNFAVNWGTRTNRGSFTVQGNGLLPEVHIEATVPETIEPSPNTRVMPGEFTITRVGDTNEPLILFVEFTGTASFGRDYQEVPRFLVMPAGSSQLTVLVGPLDDSVAEGDETMIATLSTNPPINSLPNYTVHSRLNAATVVIHDNDPPAPPLVSLELVNGQAMETRIDQNAIFWAEFRVLRTGPATNELAVYLNTRQGAARFGQDYWLDGVTDGSTVRLPAGARSVNVRLYPIDDDFYEGDESVFFHLIAPPPGSNPYEIEFERSSVSMVIHDNEPVTTRLEITAPRDGEHFEAGGVIELRAQIIGPGSSNSWSVEFFDDNQLIGTTQPGGAIWWRDAIGGRHVINARAYNPAGIPGQDTLVARPVTISVGPGAAWPVVSIGVQGFGQTLEPCPVCFVFPGVFTVSRTGPTNESLTVYLKYDGPATSGLDYAALPHQVTIPAGTNSVNILVLAIDDRLAEGPEIVRARIALPELATLGYIASFDASEAMVVINDDEPGAPEARLDIAEPQEGAQLAAGMPIAVSALGVWTQGEVDRPVEFFAGNLLIGRSNPPQLARPTIPGLPSVHTILWTNPPPGQHVLTARSELSLNLSVTSPPVRITVGAEPQRTVVRIEATHPIAEEDSIPLDRLALRGVFTISRTGPTNDSLPVYVQYSGTATAEEDYPALPWVVSIPAGATSTQIRVEPVADGVSEGIETLVATVSNCPPPWLRPPCYDFEIEPAHASATVFIRDDGITRASLVITKPKDGANFDTGETILIEATAIDLDGYISRVEFWVGETQIGVSEIHFIRPPDPGTPIHHSFEWSGAAPGAHVLTARALDSSGNAITSAPVRITVGSVGNEAPRVSITKPANGAEFPPDTAIEIVAEARDPDGYVRKMEFFADGRKIGEVSMEFIVPPDPGQTQTFTFTWRQPLPGTHALMARATDDGGATGTSAAVEIRVAASEPVPIVTVTSPDSFATEPLSNSVPNTVTFRIRRHGPTNGDLVVAYSLHGTAANGTDYETLSGIATIPAGRRSVTLTVRPLADNLTEGTETVRLRLEESPLLGPMIQYRIGRPHTAVAVISDRPWWPVPREAHCVALPGGLRHICFAADAGVNFRIEASSDLRNWETLFAAVSGDGSWHFIDEEDEPRRFYRLTPEPVAEVDE